MISGDGSTRHLALNAIARIAPALRSPWGSLALRSFAPARRWRLSGEERSLERNLPGHRQYELHVPHRLLPFRS